MIVVADLSGILFTLQAELLADELVAESLPVILRISNMVGIVITSSTTKLSSKLASLQRLKLFGKTININHDFLTQTCRRRRLSVSLSQHRHILPLVSISLELCNKFLYLWVEALLQSLLDRKRYTGVVDVLRSETEVNELLIVVQSTNLIELLLDEILYGFYVVISNLLNVLDTLSLIFVKVTVDITQALKQRLVERSQLWQRQFT